MECCDKFLSRSDICCLAVELVTHTHTRTLTHAHTHAWNIHTKWGFLVELDGRDDKTVSDKDYI